MKAYSNDLCTKVIEAYQKKVGSLRKLAERFGVSFSFVARLVKRFRDTGSVAPKPHRGGAKSKLDLVDLFTLHDLSNEHPDATFAELSELFFAQTGIKVNGSTIARKLR